MNNTLGAWCGCALMALGLLFTAEAVTAQTAAAGASETTLSASLITACQACHGRHGISESADIPNLAGQKKGYLVHQLEAFRAGERKNDLMAAMAAQLGDADIQTLATLWSELPAASAAAAPSPSVAAIRSRMQFPRDFPKGFVLYRTEPGAEEGSVVKRYANEPALRAARAGQPLPSGAIIIVENHAAQADAGGSPSYAGMESRAGWGGAIPRLLRNGDWDYALFGADRVRRDSLNQASCLACHQPKSSDSHLFTMKLLQAFASKPPSTVQ